MMADPRTRYHEGVVRRIAPLVLLCASACAALESWDGYSGGDAGTTKKDGAPEPPPVSPPPPPPPDSGPSFAFVQAKAAAAYDPATDKDFDVSTWSIALDGPETKGNLLFVAIGWFDVTASIDQINDTSGNKYLPVGAPVTHTVPTHELTQALYYARDIAAAEPGKNTITVTFTQTASGPDLRVVEYRGLSTTSPYDTTTSNAGSGSVATSAPLTPTTVPALLVGALVTEAGYAGAKYPFVGRITSSQQNLVEDLVVNQLAAYTAASDTTIDGGDKNHYIMQLAAFH
jgi:hypothetical protein